MPEPSGQDAANDEGDPVLVRHEDGVLSITLNRPARRNALSMRLLNDLLEGLSGANTSVAHAVVLSGAGGCFSAGADLAEIGGTLRDRVVDDAIEAVIAAILRLPIPVIAAIDGACMGGAFEIALSCDVRIGSAGTFFQVPATRLGLLYNPRSIARMRGRLGRDTVFNLLVLGHRFDAEEALRCGMISSLTVGETALAAALATARSSKANIGRAVAASKALLNDLDDGKFNAEYWEAIRNENLSSAERQHAVATAKARLRKS